jgi:hypothetical protein
VAPDKSPLGKEKASFDYLYSEFFFNFLFMLILVYDKQRVAIDALACRKPNLSEASLNISFGDSLLIFL